MSRLLLVSAACLCLAATPAWAAPPSGKSASGGVRIHVGDRPVGAHDHRSRRGPVLVYGFGGSEGWAYYNNRTFAPDSFNDWWHDRPDRSLPRWVGQNGGCERQYWTGSGWRC